MAAQRSRRPLSPRIAMNSRLPLVQAWGMTETSPIVTIADVARQRDHHRSAAKAQQHGPIPVRCQRTHRRRDGHCSAPRRPIGWRSTGAWPLDHRRLPRRHRRRELLHRLGRATLAPHRRHRSHQCRRLPDAHRPSQRRHQSPVANGSAPFTSKPPWSVIPMWSKLP